MARESNLVKAMNLWRTRFARFHNVTEIYKPAITRNKEKIVELIKEKTEQAAKSALARKLRVAKGFYTAELSPPSSVEEMKKLQADIALVMDFIKSGCYKYLTVKQAWLLFLVCTEVGLWFYLGETIGKMHIVGYQV